MHFLLLYKNCIKRTQICYIIPYIEYDTIKLSNYEKKVRCVEKYLTNFFEEFDYPMDARDVFLNTYRIVNSDDVARDIWNDMISV